MQDREAKEYIMITFIDSVGSTNDWIKDRIDVLSHGDGVVAARQTAGKGRLGRVWESKKGEGLFLSVMLRSEKYDDMTVIPLICGIAVCEALKKLYNIECGLKWPNDIILDGKKVGGILCEGRATSAICGIGVNLSQNKEYFDENGLYHASSLKILREIMSDTEKLAEMIVKELICTYDMLKAEGKNRIMLLYRPRCITIGREVAAYYHNDTVEGMATDVDENGNLVIETCGKKIRVNSGEVKLRMKDGGYV